MALKLLWLSPPVLFKSKGIIASWGEEMARQGSWEIVRDPAQWESCDLVFFGSDSQLREVPIGEKPTLLYFWGWPPHRLLDRKFQEFAKGRLQLMAQCTRILAPTPTVLDQLGDFGLPGMMCLPGIDARSLEVQEQRTRVAQVMFLGRLSPEKGLQVLMDAMTLLDPSPALLVCGPGDDRPEWEDQARKLNLKARFVELTDQEKAAELSRSMCLVQPSFYEGFGLPPLEALYLGTPVIAHDIPVLRWTLQEDAYFFSSVNGLAQSIAHISEHMDEALAKAAHGRERIQKSLTLGSACQALWAHIHQTIKEHLGQKIRQEPEKVAEIYDSEHRRNFAYGEQDVPGYSGPARFDPTWARHWRAQHFIERLNEKNAREILDVGCGAVYPTIFSMAGFQVTALDISGEALRQVQEIARKWGVADKVTCIKGKAQEIPLPDNSFGGVVLGEILEHVFDPEKVLAEAYRVVRPGGRIVASTPILGHHWDPMHVASEQGGWTEEGIRKLVSAYGDQVSLVAAIAEEGADPSCFLFCIDKKEV